MENAGVRFALPAVVLGAAAISGPVALGQLSLDAQTVRRVPCSEAIGATAFPYVGDRSHRYRLVLAVVSAPPAFMAQVVRVRNPTWRYWHKAGIVVRNSGETVTISVPPSRSDRAAIDWGNGGPDQPFRSVVLVGCGSEQSRGRAYAGGFYLRARAACVPLSFRVGNRTSTVRFGVGRHCN